MLDVNHIQKRFSSGGTLVNAVDDISLSVMEGEFVSIIGKSGSGKSTLLALLGALEKPTSGSIRVDNQDITRLSDRSLNSYRGRQIGFVFQNYNLIPNLTAIENVMLPMEFAGVARQEREQRAMELLTRVGLHEDEQRRKPSRLSGGQQQRVAIARALANKPKLILADEPTGNLDSQTGTMIFELLHDLSRTEQTTVVVVTHDLEVAGKTDKTFQLQDGQLVKK